MHRIYFARSIIVLIVLKFSWANESKIEIIQLNSTQKYCLIQVQHCGDDFHPLCKEPAKVFERPNAAQIEFLELNDLDKSNFLIEINKFRDKLAGGQLNGFKSGSNFRLVKWSFHFAKMAEANERYNSFCTKISINNSEFIEPEEFLDEKGIGQYFYKRALIDKVTDSYGNNIWHTLFRAEFNRIGCALTNDTTDSSYNFFCYTNRNGPEHVPLDFDSAYKRGKPCSECGTGRCNVRFRNLCDDVLTEDPDEFDHNLIDYGDYNDEVDDSHLIVYLIIGVVIMLVAISIGAIFLYFCLRDQIEDAGESYEIKQQRAKRGDMFSDTIYVY